MPNTHLMAKDIQSIASIIGLMLLGLSVAMLAPVGADIADASPFLESAGLTAFFGGALYLTGRGQEISIGMRGAYLLTVSAWMALSLFAALPLVLCGIHFSDAMFETISGLTTTGSTVLTGLDDMPDALLFWRAILQWIGGVGIIVMSIAIMPFLKIGGMQLFKTESSDTSDKELPTATKLAASTLWIYCGLTLACIVAYFEAGMTPFDAITHAMATLSTGGFSTHDASFGFFDSNLIYWISIVFMIAGGLPFVLYIKLLRGERWRSVQVRSVLVMLGVTTLALTAWLVAHNHETLFAALTESAFTIVSLVTTTGFATQDYSLWGSFAVALLFILTLFGACTGSTSGGIKMMRLIVAFKLARRELQKLVSPHQVRILRYEGKPLDVQTIDSVGAYLLIFVGSLALLTIMLEAAGLDFATSLTGAATALANVGPGFGPIIGPAGNFAPLPETAKWLLCFGMLLGRLEFFALIVLMLPSFWRR